MASKIIQNRPKSVYPHWVGAPLGASEAQDDAKRRPRGFQEAPRGQKECQKRPQDAPKSSKEAPRSQKSTPKGTETHQTATGAKERNRRREAEGKETTTREEEEKSRREEEEKKSRREEEETRRRAKERRANEERRRRKEDERKRRRKRRREDEKRGREHDRQNHQPNMTNHTHQTKQRQPACAPATRAGGMRGAIESAAPCLQGRERARREGRIRRIQERPAPRIPPAPAPFIGFMAEISSRISFGSPRRSPSLFFSAPEASQDDFKCLLAPILAATSFPEAFGSPKCRKRKANTQ